MYTIILVGLLFLFAPNCCSLPPHLNTIKYIFLHDKSSNSIPNNNMLNLNMFEIKKKPKIVTQIPKIVYKHIETNELQISQIIIK